MSAPEVYGLVLAGGRSRRMGQDKASLDYHGRPQVDVCFDLLREVCREVFLSLRPDQDAGGRPAFHDQFGPIGPMSGILSALTAHPGRAWLVVACDLPFLDRATLQHLLSRRDPARPATAFRSQHDGLPEPLCAIYEPAMADRLHAFLREGITCPRKALIRSDIALLDLPDPLALENANCPEEFEAARAALQGDAPRPRALGTGPAEHRRTCDACGPKGGARPLTVRFYAALREATGHAELSLESAAADALELYEEVRTRFNLRWPADRFRVAVNDELRPWNHALQPHDTISFIPPVAGG
jgi:molybdopterin-guanine dinucleotide biosynthesis protein A